MDKVISSVISICVYIIKKGKVLPRYFSYFITNSCRHDAGRSNISQVKC